MRRSSASRSHGRAKRTQRIPRQLGSKLGFVPATSSTSDKLYTRCPSHEYIEQAL